MSHDDVFLATACSCSTWPAAPPSPTPDPLPAPRRLRTLRRMRSCWWTCRSKGWSRQARPSSGWRRHPRARRHQPGCRWRCHGRAWPS